MRIPDLKTASKSDVAHCCASRTCVNFANRKFDSCAVANFNRVRKRIPRLFHETGAYLLFVELQLDKKSTIQSSISLESSWHEEANGAHRQELALRVNEQACSQVSEDVSKWASIKGYSFLSKFTHVRASLKKKLFQFAYNWASLPSNEQVCSIICIDPPKNLWNYKNMQNSPLMTGSLNQYRLLKS